MLRNPLYFILLLIIAVVAYVTYQLNLWGPMIQMGNAAAEQGLKEGKKYLRQALESFVNEDGGGGGGAGRGRGEAIKMGRLDGDGRRAEESEGEEI